MRHVFAEEARLDDAPALAELESQGGGSWSGSAFERELQCGSSRVWVLRRPAPEDEAASRIVAYCAFRVVADEMEVLGLAVEPRSRRQGLGRWLIRQALAAAARRGARSAFLEVRPSNGAAIALYDALGFAEAGRRARYYEEPAEDALILARTLA